MADLYIANCTKQLQSPTVKVGRIEGDRLKVERPDNYSTPIKAGTQELFFSGTQGQVNAMLWQLTRYGYVEAAAIPRTKTFIGLAFSDKPIDVDSFMVAEEQNHGILVKRGAEWRTHSANAQRDILEKTARQVGAIVTNFQTTMVQDTTKGETIGRPINETVVFREKAA